MKLETFFEKVELFADAPGGVQVIALLRKDAAHRIRQGGDAPDGRHEVLRRLIPDEEHDDREDHRGKDPHHRPFALSQDRLRLGILQEHEAIVQYDEDRHRGEQPVTGEGEAHGHRIARGRAQEDDDEQAEAGQDEHLLEVVRLVPGEVGTEVPDDAVDDELHRPRLEVLME